MKEQLLADQKSLKAQLQVINAEKQQAQQQLDEIMPFMNAAVDSLQNLTRNDAAEVGSINNPSQAVQQTCQAVMVLLNEQQTWTQAKIIVGRGDFISRIIKLNPRNMSAKQMKIFKSIVEQPSFNVDKIMLQSKAVGALAQWAKAFLKYSEVLEQAQPRLQRVENLQEVYQAKLKDYEQKQSVLQGYEEQLKLISHQLAENQAQLA